MRILLVEDDKVVGGLTQEYLNSEGYVVDWLQDGKEALLALKKESFDCLLLDIGLPQIMGLDLLEHIRGAGLTLPVIMLTVRGTVEDKVKALDLGADDYLSKPFSLKELDLRIRACLRRSAIHDHKILHTGHLSLDVEAHKVMFDDIVIEVPRREFKLLHFLMTNPGQDLSREKLMGEIYGWESNADSNALEVHIHSLRKKLKAHYIENEGAEAYISTIRGLGYIMNKKTYAAYFVMSKGTPSFSVKENAIYLYRDEPPEDIYALVVDDKKNKINFNVSAIAPPQIMVQLKWPDGMLEKNGIATELPEKLEELILTECEDRRSKETII